MCILSQFSIHGKSLPLGVCTNAHFFIYSLVIFWISTWYGYFKSTQVAAERKKYVLCPCGTCILISFPYSLKMSLIFNIFNELTLF